jgi:methylphosphotriester-DNA--protein-cysteine methyltransferase
VPKLVVAVLVYAVDARACVAAGLGAGYDVRHHASVHSLLTTLDDANPALVVIDALDSAGRSMASAVTSIRQGFPNVPILAYCSLSPSASSAVLDVARAGATGLVFRGVDDVGCAMRAALRCAVQCSVATRVHAGVVRHIPSAAQPLLRYAISRAADDPTVEDAAASVGVDRKTLFNWLRCCDIAPREFINWIRVAIGVGMLEDPRRTAEHVALELGFPSGTAFRNMLQRYTGLNCSEIRNAGGLERILDFFVSRLATDIGGTRPASEPSIAGAVWPRRA